MNIIIDERQLYIIENIIGNPQNVHYINEILTPLKKLKQCKFTLDGKYVVYEGKAYNVINGNEVPINEEWTLSDILHTGADLLSVGLDFVIPGSGAVVDILNAISYVIEAQFKSNEEKDSLYLMAAITFAFVILPGPLQAIATPLKQAVKTGKMTSPVVKQGLETIGNSIDSLLVGIPSRVNDALKSDLAVNILGKWGDKISGFISNFTSRIKQLLGTLTGKAGKEGAEVAGKKTTKEIGSSNVIAVDSNTFKKMFSTDRTLGKYGMIETSQGLTKALNKVSFDPSKVKVLSKTTHRSRGQQAIQVLGPNNTSLIFYQSRNGWIPISGYKDGRAISMVISSKYIDDFAKFLEKNGVEGLSKTAKKGAENLPAVINKVTTLSKIDNVVLGNNAPIIMNKLGITKGSKFGTKTGTAQIDDIIVVDYVLVSTTMGKEKMKVWSFLKKYIADSSAKLRNTGIPSITKGLVAVFNEDGTINQEALNKLPTITPEQAMRDLEYLSQNVAAYEGGSGKYSVNTNVLNFQKGLKMLGFNLGNFGPNKDGVDGKFGPQTQKALKDFQTQNALDSSLGRMDRATAKKLSEVLKTKNISSSEEVQTFLSSL